MRELTQTNLAPGNCFQHCVASVLDLDPELLPPQVEYDRFVVKEDGTRSYPHPHRRYDAAVNVYLQKHHGLAYLQLHVPTRELLSQMTFREPGWHFLAGNTVRTAKSGCTHLVVARYGEVAWDPHPSRAGLLDDGHRRIAMLIPWPESWSKTWGNSLGVMPDCECPPCIAERST